MISENKCANCGKPSGEKGHLCSPAAAASRAYECEHCGRTGTDPRHVCFPKLAEMKFTCGNCGRVAIEDDAVCNPQPIQGEKKDG